MFLLVPVWLSSKRRAITLQRPADPIACTLAGCTKTYNKENTQETNVLALHPLSHEFSTIVLDLEDKCTDDEIPGLKVAVVPSTFGVQTNRMSS